MKRIFFIIALIFQTQTLFATQAEVQNISSEKYFEATLNEINSAKSSVFVVMYLVSIHPDQPNSQPTQLINALIKAKDRGVQVKVILDQNIDFESESTDDAVAQNKNQQGFELLKKNNIPVFFDTSETYTHTKAIVIDNEIVILGSTNWSKAALTRNNEADVLIRSKEFAQSLLEDFSKIQLQENIPASLTPKVPIPKTFLTDKKLLGEMSSQSDERAFDTYLYLLKEFNGNKENTLTLDYDNLAKSIAIDHMTKEDYRRQINKTLDKLEAKYKLIKFQNPKRNQDTQIQLLSNSNDLEENINIPTTYWCNDWNKNLSFPAKTMYLINLLYSQGSPQGSFSISRENLSKNHGISESFISQGNQELRRLNLLNIKYSELEDMKFSSREPSVYTLKDLYNPEDLKEDLAKLKQKHGQEKLNRATKAASLVFEENNLKTIQTLIDLENLYGIQTVEEASNKISQKNPDNPKRSAGYLINTIKSMGTKK